MKPATRMTAKEKFITGERVQWTKQAVVENIPARFDKTGQGIVVGFSFQCEFLVRVKRDSHSRAERFHMDFWEPVTKRKC